jgi:hypothetical protein
MPFLFRSRRRFPVHMKVLLFLPLAACTFLSVQGCSVYLALNQPSLKDLSVLETETPQEAVVAELGPPIWTEKRDSETVAIHKFMQGYSTTRKRTLATLHTIADIASFGLLEVPGTLMEKYGLVGVSMTAKITYDANGKLRAAELFDPRQIPDKLQILQSGSMGIALAPAPQPELQTPSKGRLASAGRGATAGTALGSMAAAPVMWAPPLAVLVSAGGMVIGSITGAVYGATTAEPASSLEATELVLKTSLQDLAIPESLRYEISLEARDLLHIEITSLTDDEVAAAQIEGSYPAFDSRNMTTMLELSPVGIELRNAEWGVHPNKQLVLAVWARLIRTVDGLEIGSWYLTQEDSPRLLLNEWAAEGGRRFRERVIETTHRLGDRVASLLRSTSLHN